MLRRLYDNIDETTGKDVLSTQVIMTALAYFAIYNHRFYQVISIGIANRVYISATR